MGLLIPMVLPATDLPHLRSVHSACLPAAEQFASEPEWGEWLRATHPIIGHYYDRDRRTSRVAALLTERVGLPARLVGELCALGSVHRFPAGTFLLREEDRATCAFIAMEGELSVRRRRGSDADESAPRRAADGVAYARAATRCETDADVLCVPVTAIARLQRRHPAHTAPLQELVSASV
ncbi:MAG: cyclic nucleotide-binding domain-containing protein [bacterium]